VSFEYTVTNKYNIHLSYDFIRVSVTYIFIRVSVIYRKCFTSKVQSFDFLLLFF